MAINTNFEARDHFNAIAQFSNFAVDAHAPRFNDRFDFTTGAVASTRQHFLQFFAFLSLIELPSGVAFTGVWVYFQKQCVEFF